MDTKTLLVRAEHLRAMTETRGCSPSEAEAAALKLGRLLQQHPELHLTTSAQQETTNGRRWHEQKPDFWGFSRSEEQRKGYHVGMVTICGSTEKAFYVRHEETGESLWMPKSQITVDYNEWRHFTTVDLWVSHWFAEQRGWK